VEGQVPFFKKSSGQLSQLWFMNWSSSMALITLSQPYLGECEDRFTLSKFGTWESFGIPKTSEFDCKGQKHFAFGCSLYH